MTSSKCVGDFERLQEVQTVRFDLRKACRRLAEVRTVRFDLRKARRRLAEL